MNVKVVETKRYDCDLNIVDIDVISEEERLSLKGVEQIDLKLQRIARFNMQCKETRMPFFCVGAVLMFSDSDLPIGTEFYLRNNVLEDIFNSWYVFSNNKALGIAQFTPDAYTEDESRLKELLLLWANINGIKLGE